MSLIHAANIAAYIQFLYQQKYRTAAPMEVIRSWSEIPEEEFEVQLAALYQHWGMDAAEAQRYEQAFLMQNQPATATGNPSPPPQRSMPVYTPPPAYAAAPPPQKNNFWKTTAIVLILLLLGAGGILGYQLYQNQQQSTSNSSTFVADTNTRDAIAAPPAEEPAPMAPDLPLNDTDATNIDAIHQLLAAEDRQDSAIILNFYAPYMERYWDISYPTQEQLKKRYQDSWQKMADAQNTVKAIRKIAPHTYDADVHFSYYSIPEDATQTSNSTLRFVFNEAHQITQVYKLK